jgi:hypothetical protein
MKNSINIRKTLQAPISITLEMTLLPAIQALTVLKKSLLNPNLTHQNQRQFQLSNLLLAYSLTLKEEVTKQAKHI